MPDSSRSTSSGHRGQPLGGEQVAERRAEEPLEADEQARVVLVPAEALAAGVPVRQLVDGRPHRGEHLEAGGHERRAVLVGQDQRVLGRQRERLRGRVVGHVAGGRLRGEPFPHVALGVAAGAAPARRWCCPGGRPGRATARAGSPGRRAACCGRCRGRSRSSSRTPRPWPRRSRSPRRAARRPRRGSWWWSCRSFLVDGPGGPPSTTTLREGAGTPLSSRGPVPRLRDSAVTVRVGEDGPMSDADLSWLGTTVLVWAHPDDETYLSGGTAAALVDLGHRVVAVTATRGEAGGPDTTAGRAGGDGAGAHRGARGGHAAARRDRARLARLRGRRLRRGRPRARRTTPRGPVRRRPARHGPDLRAGRVHRPPGPPDGEPLGGPRAGPQQCGAPAAARRRHRAGPRRPGARRGLRGLRARPAADVRAGRAGPPARPRPGLAPTQGGGAAGAGVADHRSDRGRRPGPVHRLGRGRGVRRSRSAAAAPAH